MHRCQKLLCELTSLIMTCVAAVCCLMDFSSITKVQIFYKSIIHNLLN